MGGKEIVYVTDYLNAGGLERVISSLTEAWVNAGYRIITVTLMNDKLTNKYDISDRIEMVHFEPASKIKVFRTVAHCVQLTRFLRKHRDAVTVAFSNNAIRVLAVAASITGNKKIFSERNNPCLSPPTKKGRVLRNAAYYFGNADTYVFQTEEAMHFFPKKVQAKGVIIPNPINPNLPAVWTGERRKTVLTACRLSAQKNLPMLVCAFAKFSVDHPDYILEIYGSGIYEANGGHEGLLRDLIRSLDLEDKVFLRGHSDRIYEKMRDCGMYVSSSNYEGISNSVMEALGMGIPTIATDCPVGGSRMLIQDGENGLLIPVGGEEALYRAMKRIVEEPGLAEKLSRNAVHIREKYSIDKISRRWLDVM